MTIWWFYLVTAFIVLAGAAFIYLVLSISHGGGSKTPKTLEDLDEATEKDIIEHIFSPEFREELKNRGRLHFEKIINESADFLQQDLRLTSSQLNESMKKELTSKVQEELAKYEQSINDARTMAIDSIKKTTESLEEQRKILGEQVQKEIEIEKARIIESFERQIADIFSHYVVAAIGNQIDLDDQLEYILSDLETNKQAMLEDIKNA
ncbi:MAG TPA: hypothetical protein VGF75_05935 [Candidatus Saccharimonadales bacterium]|jgi:F0F1-type ATP synthase membrane subunit b/b'